MIRNGTELVEASWDQAMDLMLWSRILDRLAGSQPLRLVAVDPRQTPVAKAAEIHLAPRPGTNLALVNASCSS